MKLKYIATALSMLAIAQAAIAAEAPDTLLRVTSPSRVIITENPEGVRFTVEGCAGDSTFQTSVVQEYVPGNIMKTSQRITTDRRGGLSVSMRNKRWSLISGSVLLGFVSAPGAPSEMELEMSKSFEIAWLKVIGVSYKCGSLGSNASAAIGIDWRNYRTTTGPRIVSSHGLTWSESFTEGVQPRFSRIKTFSLPLSLSWEQKMPFKILGSRFSVEASVLLNWNVYGSTLNTWRRDDGTDVEEFNDNIGLRKFTVDFMGTVRLCSFAGWYFRYSPCDVLQGRSPRFKTFSTGLNILF